MCGIFSAVAKRDIVPILLAGLLPLEYRGYDSAGLAIVDQQGKLQRIRRVGKIKILAEALEQTSLHGYCGIAHTRWATHGVSSEKNAHPHICEHIAIVHNGVIENHQVLRESLEQEGYQFSSDTDSETIAHMIHWQQTKMGEALKQKNQATSKSEVSLLVAVQQVIACLQGTYAIVVMDSRDPSRLIAARSGSPLVIGCANNEHFVASDQIALATVADHFIFLQEGDIAEITAQKFTVYDINRQLVQRPLVKNLNDGNAFVEKGHYRHYMQKEIYEQPAAIEKTIACRVIEDRINLTELDLHTRHCLEQAEHLHIVACGTAYNAGMVARYWFESLAFTACEVEIASEFRYLQPAKRNNSILILISQSGETADTLASLRAARSLGYLTTLALCNVSGSTLAREANFSLITHAGREIGVASTKAFTTQLVLLLLLVVAIGRTKEMTFKQEQKIIKALKELPKHITKILQREQEIAILANQIACAANVLFIGRGSLYPIAMEGALKLKEISYLHAQAHAAGELKHGPLALVDADTPLVVLAPYYELSEKLSINIEEIHARNGQLYLFADERLNFSNMNAKLFSLPQVEPVIAPIYYNVPMQLLAYHIALCKGTDIDKPRNLAKSVTVE